MSKGLPKRSEDYSLWYNELVKKADLAENSAVRGCMVIKPYGFSIWEKMQAELDPMFKETRHSNAYFPLFIPKSYLSKEVAIMFTLLPNTFLSSTLDIIIFLFFKHHLM